MASCTTRNVTWRNAFRLDILSVVDSSGTLETGSVRQSVQTESGAARQQSDLLRWLAANPPPPPEMARRIESKIQKVRSLRQALAAEGLHILPDPLHRTPAHKVAKLRDLLDD